MVLDVLKMIVALVQALAWPVVVLIIIGWFRGPLAALIRRLKSFKGPGGVAGEFAEEAAEIVDELKAIATPAEQERLTELQERLAELARRQNHLVFGCVTTLRRLRLIIKGTHLSRDEVLEQVAVAEMHLSVAMVGADLMGMTHGAPEA